MSNNCQVGKQSTNLPPSLPPPPLTHVDERDPDPVARLAVPGLDGGGQLEVAQGGGKVLPPPLQDATVELHLGALPAHL